MAICTRRAGWVGAAYKLLLVAFSICSSRAVFAPEDHQLIILTAQNCSFCLAEMQAATIAKSKATVWGMMSCQDARLAAFTRIAAVSAVGSTCAMTQPWHCIAGWSRLAKEKEQAGNARVDFCNTGPTSNNCCVSDLSWQCLIPTKIFQYAVAKARGWTVGGDS